MTTDTRPTTASSSAGTRRRAGRPGVGNGTTSLLVIFTLLCLATLALLSLSTAESDRRISHRSLEGIHNMAAAKGAAAETIARADEALARAQTAWREGDDETRYFMQAQQELTALGYEVNLETRTASFTLMIDENNELVTIIRLLAPGGGTRYEMMAQNSRMVGDWVPGGDGPLWTGGTN